MANTILIKRGQEENLPTLQVGELALTTDTHKVFVGTDQGNQPIVGDFNIDELTINKNSEGKTEAVGTKEKNKDSVKYDWIGTLEEYTQQLNSGKIKDTWVCFITDDVDEDIGETDIYSTTEIKTNKIWINGKPIYRKVFQCNIDIHKSGWKEVGTVEFEDIVSSSFICTTPSEPTRYRTNPVFANLSFYNNKCYAAGNDLFTSELILKTVIVEYTKT